MELFYPIAMFAQWLVFSLFGFDKEGVIGESLNFFIYDIIKIFILLAVIIFLVSFLRTYLVPAKIRAVLSRKRVMFGNMLAATIGIFTPFCSCSAVPLFIGFVEVGVPLGVTFSYLIAAPLINEIAAVLLWGLFGWKIALLYIASGWLIAVFVGFLLGTFKLEHLVENYSMRLNNKNSCACSKPSLKNRFGMAFDNTKHILKKVFPYAVLGIAIGALIHGYAPENLLSSIASKENLLAVPIAVLIGVPLYSNAAGVVPVVSSLIAKGLPIGTALAFMMAVVALSLPEMIILRKVLKPKLLALYFGILTLGIICIGYLFNILL